MKNFRHCIMKLGKCRNFFWPFGQNKLPFSTLYPFFTILIGITFYRNEKVEILFFSQILFFASVIIIILNIENFPMVENDNGVGFPMDPLTLKDLRTKQF